jgi:hypothetical protein
MIFLIHLFVKHYQINYIEQQTYPMIIILYLTMILTTHK